ncbi:MAG: hypothetical protein NZ845_01740 [Thermodesulfovibrio sp.]|nr:hypothetical protein [Thermodesulfovibrio sp.]
MNLLADIEGIKYTPFLCRNLKEYDLSDLDNAFKTDATFILRIDENNKIAISWWVSPKRTRSYPYARVYDSLGFQGKRVTLIPIIKDEGKDGDRDFLQWDTISLMSLLGIYVIICYYKNAEKNLKFEHKITNQSFDIEYIKTKIEELLSYQSNALHWNITQIENIAKVAERALEYYKEISKKLKVKLHSARGIERRIKEILNEKNSFLNFSRDLAEKAQNREYQTIQSKEKLSGQKAKITIKNYLGGCYFLTCDEIVIEGDKISLIECKHSRNSFIPSISDIKDGLIKMILFSNLKNLRINDKEFHHKSILKLTSAKSFDLNIIRKSDFLSLLNKESQINNFSVFLNDKDLKTIVGLKEK